MKGTFPLPTEVTFERIPMNYGVEGRVSKCGRMCMVTINSQLTQSVNSWTSYGTLPHPREQVIAPNCAGMDCYLVLNYDGSLLCSASIPKNSWVQTTFTYMMADTQ